MKTAGDLKSEFIPKGENMKKRKLLDGYGIKLKAIWGRKIYYEDLHPDGLYDIVIETDNGNYVIGGCSNCETVFFRKSEEELAVLLER